LDAPEGIAEGQEEATRSAKGTPAAISLVDVKNIYVDLPGSDSFSQQLRNALISALDSTGHFTSASTRERADAVLKGSVRRRSGPGRRPDAEIAEYTLSLVEANGNPLWSTARWPRITKYKGPVAGLADLVVKEIAAKKEEARRAGEKIK